jgi:hypothetical protein
MKSVAIQSPSSLAASPGGALPGGNGIGQGWRHWANGAAHDAFGTERHAKVTVATTEISSRAVISVDTDEPIVTILAGIAEIAAIRRGGIGEIDACGGGIGRRHADAGVRVTARADIEVGSVAPVVWKRRAGPGLTGGRRRVADLRARIAAGSATGDVIGTRAEAGAIEALQGAGTIACVSIRRIRGRRRPGTRTARRMDRRNRHHRRRYRRGTIRSSRCRGCRRRRSP